MQDILTTWFYQVSYRGYGNGNMLIMGTVNVSNAEYIVRDFQNM